MEFKVLGPLEVRRDGDALAVPAGKPRAVLAVLLLHANEPVSAERLALALWGQDAPAGAIRTVQVYVSRLRRALGDDERMSSSRAGYRLQVRPGELDLERFEGLVEEGRRAIAQGHAEQAAGLLGEALDLWRGPALADVAFEPFTQAEIARLQELRLAAVESRIEADLAAGRHADLVPELQRLVVEHPLRERLHADLMLALYHSGRQADALDAYRHARELLVDQLGIEPGNDLRELQQGILAQDPRLSFDVPVGANSAIRPEARPERVPQRWSPIPAPPTSTVGREREIASVAVALVDSRLVTLIGPGGVGKTRVAVEAARELGDRYSGGVHAAWLANVAHHADVPAALVTAVGAVLQPGERPEDALARRLAGPSVLLLADNLEHVLDSAALFAELLARCPQLQILATSREPLRLRAERCLPVAPLSVRDGAALFVERARNRRPEFGLTDVNAPAVEELSRRLDGLPLALELAAGRIGLLEPDQLLARLGDALPILEGGARDAPARQRTIRATLEWSVALLDEHERSAFLALGAFIGGAEIHAAEEVTQSRFDVLDALVAKSLVQRRDDRLTMLEVVRQFAAAGLDASPECDAIRSRHADWCLALAERLAREVFIHGEGQALHRLERDLANLRNALQWCLSRRAGEPSLRLALALEPYWEVRKGHREAARALDAALALGGPARERGRAHWARSTMISWRNPDQAREDIRIALDLAVATGDLEGQCMALDELAATAALNADFATAARLARRQRASAEILGDEFQLAMAIKRQAFAEPGLRKARAYAEEAAGVLRRCGAVGRIAQMLGSVVMVALTEEDYEAALELADEQLRAADEAGNRFARMNALGHAGLSALFVEDMRSAEHRFREQIAICRDERVEALWAEPALGLAAVAANAGDHERAAILEGACESPLLESIGEADVPVYDRIRARFIAPARCAIGEAAWTHARETGATLAPADVFDLALAAAAKARVASREVSPPAR